MKLDRKPTKLPWLLLIVIVLTFAQSPLAAGASEETAEFVRGKVKVETSDGRQLAAPGQAVELVQEARDFTAKAYTRSDGMYHFRNVRYGEYELHVEDRGKTLKFEVDVDEEIENVPPVILR